MDPFGQAKRSTSIVRSLKPDGTYVDVVSSSEPRLALAQRNALNAGASDPLSVSGETEARYVNPDWHAEIKGINYAQGQGWQPVEVAVAGPQPDWPICATCSPEILASGTMPVSPFLLDIP